MTKFSILHLIASFALLMPGTAAHAANAIGNSLTLPNDAIKHVEIAAAQESIGIKALPPNYAMGGTLILLTSGLAEKRLRPALDKASQEAPTTYIREEALRSVREHLDLAHFPSLAGTDFVVPAAAAPDRTSPDRLYLNFEVYFTGNLRTLQVAMHALVADDAQGGKRKITFMQDLYYTVPIENAGVFLSPGEGADYWQGQDATVVRRHIAKGMDELVAMLNREVTRQPVKERIPGRQFGWDDGQMGTYGVILDQVGDRVWLRLRSGRLASIPKPGK